MMLPDCMMPDGATPCRGYHELYADNEQLRRQTQNALREIELLTASRREIMKIDEERVAEIEQLRMQLANHGEHITRLETANERLKAVLERIRAKVDGRTPTDIYELGDIARVELECKP